MKTEIREAIHALDWALENTKPAIPELQSDLFNILTNACEGLKRLEGEAAEPDGWIYREKHVITCEIYNSSSEVFKKQCEKYYRSPSPSFSPPTDEQAMV
jgi:hypothetical protein